MFDRNNKLLYIFIYVYDYYYFTNSQYKPYHYIIIYSIMIRFNSVSNDINDIII